MSKLSIILSIALALSAVFSPIFVAIINNWNTSRLRIAEFKHLEETRFQKEYDAKKDAFLDLIKSATRYHSDSNNQKALDSLYSSAYCSIAVCSTDTCKNAISSFVECLVASRGKDNVEEHFLSDFSILSHSLSTELFIRDNPFESFKEK